MHFSTQYISLFLTLQHGEAAIVTRAPARMAVTDNIMHLRTVTYALQQMLASSRSLHKRRPALWSSDSRDISAHHAALLKRQQAVGEEDLITIGGRVYMTDVTLGGQDFVLVMDTGSSDTWVTSSRFRCLDPSRKKTMGQGQCGFNASYDPERSNTWRSLSDEEFSVNYTGGEFLRGEMGTELLGIGDVSHSGVPALVVNQTIGVVEEGYWEGDGISSGLMGLAFPALVSQARESAYTSVMSTLTNTPGVPKIFSLALSRPTPSNPSGGGILAIGGVPNIPLISPFIYTPMLPATSSLDSGDVFAWYSITVTGIEITAPSSSSTDTNDEAIVYEPPVIVPSPKSKSTYIIDSGTSLIYLPSPLASRIASSFSPPAYLHPISSLYIVPCNATPPKLAFIINKHKFVMSEEDLMNRGAGAVGGPGLGARRDECVLGVQTGGAGVNVLGDAWLKGVLVVMDLEGKGVWVAGRA